MVIEGDHGLLIYVGLLTTGAFLVGALALRMDMQPRELGDALMYVTAHLTSSPSKDTLRGVASWSSPRSSCFLPC